MTDYQRPDDIDTQLTPAETHALFRGFLRYPNLFREATRVNLDESRFRYDENVFAMIFGSLRALYAQYPTVSKDMLLLHLKSGLDAGTIPLGPNEIVFLFGAVDGQGFIDEAYDTPLPDEAAQRDERRHLESILRRFVHVRLLKPQMQTVLNRGTEDTAPEQIKSLLLRFNRLADQAAQIGAPVANSAAMPAFGSPVALPPPAVPTGLAFIDQYVGGARPGDVMGLLGAFGAGKTTILITSTVRMAEFYATQGQNKLSVLIGYEDGAERINPMAWSAAARIERRAFDTHGDAFWEAMSTRENLKDYDRHLPENRNGELVFGERERWEMAMSWYNRHFAFLDFSNNSSSGGRGEGGTEEIRIALERLADERGMEIGFVGIDYAGLLVERYLAATGNVRAMTDQAALIRPIKQVPDALRTQVAVPMRATVFLAHQLAQGETQKIRSYQYISHSSASGSKSFAENVHSCMCVNTKDLATNVSTIYWSKIRTGVPLTPHGLIRMDDHVVDVHLVNDEYTACAASRAILRRGDVRVVTPPTGGQDTTRQRGWTVDSFAGDM